MWRVSLYLILLLDPLNQIISDGMRANATACKELWDYANQLGMIVSCLAMSAVRSFGAADRHLSREPGYLAEEIHL